MSNNVRSTLIEKQKVYACTDSGSASSVQAPISSSARDLFTRQTGQILTEIGSMFVNVPPFNDHIDRNTANLLISLGRKLQSKK